MRIRNILLGAAAVLLLAAPVVYATCADGLLECDLACHTATPCGSGAGTSFSGMCVGGNAQKRVDLSACRLVHCGSASPICASGPFGRSGCNSDGQCAAGEICASSAGSGACGTGSSQCMHSCSDATTSTTTSTTTTTVATTTTT